MTWNDPQTELIIYLIYGTSFILMFSIMTIWRKRVAHIEFMKDFRHLAAFGLIQGLGEYSEIPRFLAIQPTWLFDSIRIILISSSFAALLSFGLSMITIENEEDRWIRGAPYGGLIIYFWLLFFIGLDFKNSGNGINYNFADLAIQYSMGFLGAVVSAYSFLRISGKMKEVIGERAEEILFITGICFGLYAIFGGLIESTLTVIGIPVVVYRTVIAVLITICVIEIFQMFRLDKTPNKKEIGKT